MIENTYGESQTNAKMMYYALCDSSNREEEKKHDHERTNKQTNEQYHTITLYLSSPLHPQHNTTAISTQAKSPPNRIASDIPRPNLLKMLVTS